MRFLNLKLHSVWFTLSIAIFYILFLNMGMLRELYNIFLNLEEVNLIFIASVFFFFIAVFNIVFTLFTIKYLEKPFFIFLILTSSLVNFAMYHYRIIFDFDMMTNIFETNSSEASSYLNWSFATWFFITGLLPSFLVFKMTITHSTLLKDVLFKIVSIIVSIAIIGLIATFFYKDYASVIRNNSYLRKQIVPSYYITNTVKYFNQKYFFEPLPYQKIGSDAVQKQSSKKDIMVVIVGETARSQNYGLNGYHRDTNAHSKNINNLISFQNTSSCGTATAISLPCMFSTLNRKDYSRALFDSQDNVVDIMKYAGVKMLWQDNNTGCKGVCRNIETITIPKKENRYCDGSVCTDDVFLEDLQANIDDMKETGGVIFMHVMGSHGPTYFKRVPDKHKKFMPECGRSDIQNCSDEEIVNSYDNTILFTDYVMAKTVETLKENSTQLNTAMLYISDHGESLGEGGLYLHGMPYSVAPETQTKVPFILWMDDNKIKDDGLDYACLEQRAKNDNFSHDNLSHTLLGLMNVETEAKDRSLDILEACKK